MGIKIYQLSFNFCFELFIITRKKLFIVNCVFLLCFKFLFTFYVFTVYMSIYWFVLSNCFLIFKYQSLMFDLCSNLFMGKSNSFWWNHIMLSSASKIQFLGWVMVYCLDISIDRWNKSPVVERKCLMKIIAVYFIKCRDFIC